MNNTDFHLFNLFHEYGRFSFDTTSIVFSALIAFTLMVVAKYSKNYLKGEVGAFRFWLLFCFFSIGILITCFAENLKTFYVGWEIVGLASFFLIGFYQTNVRSLENSLIALANYKICDAFFLMGIFLHESHFTVASGFCLIIATLAKSAQLPFSSWLYRALEGPTPSSTLFYGGLSLHLGAFLLLKFAPLWDFSPELRIFVGALGLLSAAFGFIVGSTRSDLKTSFAFASISQVGLIYFELSLGWYHLALWHIVGHNLLRTWNYLRGMSFFDDFFKEDYHRFNSMISWKKVFSMLPSSLFFHSMNGFYLDFFSTKLRQYGLVIVSGLCLLGLIRTNQTPGSELSLFTFICLVSAMILSAVLFLKERLHPAYFLIGLLGSQILLLAAIHTFFEDSIEHTYLYVTLISIGFLFYSLFPAFQFWTKTRKSNFEKKQFLGMGLQFKWRHVIFLVSAILMTGSPGSFEFFIQEGILDELWSKSHLFLMITMLCLTLNTIHTFKIGQFAFLGEK